MAGFFSSKASAVRTPLRLVPDCNKCGLYKKCKSPKMKLSGKGSRRILIVGDRPGPQEDKQGKQFVGGVGRYLADTIRKVGGDMRNDCTLTNAVICFSNDDKANATAIPHCQPNVIDTISRTNPEVIILLGGMAVKSVMSWLYKEEVGDVGRWVGYQIPSQRLNAWVCPSWNPSYLLRSQTRGQIDPVLERMFERHIESAFDIESRPWNRLPDYKKKIKLVYDDDKAAESIYQMTRSSRAVAFDYETDRLKPDHKDARIYTCSICDGRLSIAFLWRGKAVKAMSEFLQSDVPKIGWNIKFEERWTRRVLGHGVNNWQKWNSDGMINAHLIDNREGITGLKFQAFIRYGIDSYDDDIRPYLESRNSNAPNRITEAPIEKVLEYNAMDSLLEWKIVHDQIANK